jgi:peroxiredoxin
MRKYLYTILGLAALSLTVLAQTSGYKIGDVATDFELMGTDDKVHSLSDFEDVNGYIVIFTCNHCPYSKAYEDRIIALQAEYGPQGYPVIAINPNDPAVNEEDSFEKMKVRAKEKGFNFPYLFDDGQTVYPQYGATRTPHVFLLDKERVVRYIGAIDDNVSNEDEVKDQYLINAIEALKKGKSPKPAKTKAIGCSIKAQ